MDERIRDHARILVDYSIEAAEGDHVLITASSEAEPLVRALYEELGHVGAVPITVWRDESGLERHLIEAWGDDPYPSPEPMLAAMDNADAFIGINSSENQFNRSDLPSGAMSAHESLVQELIQKQVEMNWVRTKHPTPAAAQLAEMSTKAYKEMFYDAVIRDWDEQEQYQLQLADLLEDTDSVRIVSGNGTDIRAELGDIGGENPGALNLPCGEVGTSPVWRSVEGTVRFDYPALIEGSFVSGIELRFEEGEVVEYSAETNEDVLKAHLETDAGASRLGEIGFGMNRGMTEPTTDTLLDEKLGGTVHLALGWAYADGDEYNDSAVHTDIVLEMREDAFIEVDGEVIFRDGWYVFDSEFEAEENT